MLATGDVFAGYAIERQLGRGGMGSVYLARHPRLPRQTALKVLNPELFADAEMRVRFEREADLAAQLEHPNVVTVYDRGVDEDRLWISMQFVDGVDAAAIPRPVPVERALRIIEGTAAALDHAHRNGVLHRDVKPANILLADRDGEERVLLTDFGIARPRDDVHHLTQTGTFTATLAYAAPEQLTGAHLDHRADQYSLACTLFALLTGVGPFAAANPVLVIQGHLQSLPPSVRGQRRELPAALDAVLARALAKRPADRFDSCAEFAAAARRALTGNGSEPTVLGAPSSPQLPQANSSAPTAPIAHGAAPPRHTGAPTPHRAALSPSTQRAAMPPRAAPQHGNAPRQDSVPRQGHAPQHGSATRQDSAPRQGNAARQDSVPRQGHAPGHGDAAPQGSAPRQGGHAPQDGNVSAQGSAPRQGHARQHGNAARQSSTPQQSLRPESDMPRPVAPERPNPQRPAARARRRRRGPLVALAIVVALLAGAGVWVWRDDTGFVAVTLGRSQGHTDLNAMAAAFPSMLPDSHRGSDGYYFTTCRAVPQWQPSFARQGLESAFDGWQAMWECLGPSGDGFAFRFYSFDVAPAAESAVNTFAVDAEDRGESTGVFRRDRRFVYQDEYGGVVSTVISSFTDPQRERFVLFTIPQVKGEQVLDELSQQVAAVPW
ncbi:protein kinase [Nocardia sp. NPDC058176]|uniref:serine/threonine-protein kinase n=1 Tax=Nocardia sp. NPDC058176 TaxID=3346368 RepID=UPI0036D8FAB3